MKKILYHGSKNIEDLKSIKKNGFDLNKIGTGWGITYGNGIYFTDNINIAHEIYSEKNGYVLKIILDVECLQLKKDYSVSNKKQIKKIIKENIQSKKYNMLITNSKEPEYILFDLEKIVSIDLIQL